MEVEGGDVADMGVEREAHPQLFQKGKVAMGSPGGLEVCRYAAAVWKTLVVGFLLLRLPFPAGTIFRLLNPPFLGSSLQDGCLMNCPDEILLILVHP